MLLPIQIAATHLKSFKPVSFLQGTRNGYVSLHRPHMRLINHLIFSVEILELRAEFQTSMMWWSRFIWITNSSDHRRVWIANLLHTMSYLTRPSGLSNDFFCKRFAVQVIQVNLEHGTIAIFSVELSWGFCVHC